MNRKGKIERAWWKKEGEEIVKINGCTLSGYFSQFAVFGRKKKMPNGNGFTRRPWRFWKSGWIILTGKRSGRDPSRILHAVYCSNTVQHKLRVKQFCTLNVWAPASLYWKWRVNFFVYQLKIIRLAWISFLMQRPSDVAGRNFRCLDQELATPGEGRNSG